VGGERRDGGGGGRRERGREVAGVFFFSSFSMTFHGVPFFGVEMQVEKPCQLVSSCFLMFLQLGKSLPSSYLATKFETW
jgi:hypothetical protein